MSWLVAFWKRNFLVLEALVAVALTAAFAVWYFLWEGSVSVEELLRDNKGNVYRTVATISASLLGFSITATSIIFALSSHERLELLRTSPRYSDLWSTLNSNHTQSCRSLSDHNSVFTRGQRLISGILAGGMDVCSLLFFRCLVHSTSAEDHLVA